MYVDHSIQLNLATVLCIAPSVNVLCNIGVLGDRYVELICHIMASSSHSLLHGIQSCFQVGVLADELVSSGLSFFNLRKEVVRNRRSGLWIISKRLNKLKIFYSFQFFGSLCTPYPTGSAKIPSLLKSSFVIFLVSAF